MFNSQVVIYSINFNYAKEHRRAWMYSIGTIAFVLFLLATSFHTFSHYESSYDVLNLIDFIGASILQIIVPAAPSVSYVTLLRGLYKRYRALNSIFRYKR